MDATPAGGVTSYGGPQGSANRFHSTPPDSYYLIFVDARTRQFVFAAFH
jgi:hypothetical protein